MSLALLVVLTVLIVAISSVLPQWVTARRARSETPVERLRDPLTGLPSDEWLSVRLEQALARARRHDAVLALLAVAVDDFAGIRERLDEERCEALLAEVARRLRECARAEDTVARLPDDAFAVLLEETADTNAAARIGRRIVDSLREPVLLGPVDVAMTVSVGVAVIEHVETTGTELVEQARLSLRRAQQNGGSRFDMFDSAVARRAVARLDLEARMREAVAEQELLLHYQPEVDLHTGEIVGMEALVRWQHPTLGLLRPDQFIVVAEETGLIRPIGQWVLNEACAAVVRAHDKNLIGPEFRISINCSFRQLQGTTDFLDQVADALAGTGLAPRALAVEVRQANERLDTVVPALESLRAMGVGVALDDFGAGYPSLAQLKSLPVNIVKIDRRFVQGIDHPANLAIVRGVIDLARTLRLQVTAEGIETQRQLDVMQRCDCDRGHGHYFCPALPLDEVFAVLEAAALPLDGASFAAPIQLPG